MRALGAVRASAHDVAGDLRVTVVRAGRDAVSAPVTRPGRGLSRRTNVGKPLLVAGVADALIDELRSTSGWSGRMIDLRRSMS
jgi:voltage-gated potassium channel Kch